MSLILTWLLEWIGTPSQQAHPLQSWPLPRPELLKGYLRQRKLQTYALQCANTIYVDPALLAKVGDLKKAGELLPFLKRK